jgi:nitric oxide synthase-interacting protein
MDPVTKDTFSNKSVLVCLKPTGDVILEATYKKLIKPDGRFNSTKIRERDVVKLQRGGTGFAAHDGDKTESKKFFHLGPGSGLADLRGQHRGAPSRGGLAIMN